MSKDWNRASFEANTRPIHVERDITSADLVVPSNGGLLVLTLGCIACGLGLAFLFVFWPLMLVDALVTEQLVRDVAANPQLPDEEPGGEDDPAGQHGRNDPTTHSDVEERDEHERPEDEEERKPEATGDAPQCEYVRAGRHYSVRRDPQR